MPENNINSVAQPGRPSLSQDTDSTAAEQFVNVSGYRFVRLIDLLELQESMRAAFAEIEIKGTVLIAEEGINAALSGTREQVDKTKAWFDQDARFSGMWFKESISPTQPFANMKVRVRDEIITFQPNDSARIFPADQPAPNMDPATLKSWLDEARKFTLLDTRNVYEVKSGTFESAHDLQIETFKQFAAAIEQGLEEGSLSKDEPVVTFCTGGIRCEKAAPYLLQNGFKEVYQVEGGILNYFETCGDAHWNGDCFVFDDRIEIHPNLEPTGAERCEECHQAIPPGTTHVCEYEPGEFRSSG